VRLVAPQLRVIGEQLLLDDTNEDQAARAPTPRAAHISNH
jgi:hypothetical protein